MVTADPVIDENLLEEPSFSDPEDFVDTACDEELVGDILRKEPQLSEYEHCCIIVSGIPVVTSERLERLKMVLRKLFGHIHPEYNDFYPVDSDGSTKNYCFVEYPNAKIAENAKAIFHNYLLDKKHTFSADFFSDLHKFKKPDENWQVPEPRPFSNVGDLWWWLQNEKCYDQFAVHYQRELQGPKCVPGEVEPCVAVYEYAKGQDPLLVAEREYWTETAFTWSPNGSFFVSVHHLGAVLWAGAKFAKFAKYTHEGIVMLDFSPCERFLVTYSLPENRWADDSNCLRVFDTLTGEMRRSFSLISQQESNELPCWPYFQWSSGAQNLNAAFRSDSDVEGFAACPRPGGNGICVYETKNFTLLDKKHVSLEGLRSFRWSSSRPILAYYCEERTTDSTPAEIGLMEFPSKNKLRTQRIFSVSEAELFWNKNGDRLAAHTERYQKKIIKTSSAGTVEDIKYTNPTSHIEIFDVRRKDISVLSMPLQELFISFDWEPSGEKFCVLVGSQHKSTPLIYHLDTTKHVPQLLSKFEPMERFTNVLWAPAGNWLTVYSASSSSGSIMFIDSNGSEPTRTNLVEYPGFNKGSWDPTGRYFAATCTVGGGKGDTGYRIYTFQGRELYRKPIDSLLQFKWRPRLPVKLPESTVKRTRKTLKATSVRFEDEDKLERGRATKEVSEKKKKIMSEFQAIRNRISNNLSCDVKLRLELRGGLDTTKVDADDLVEETITVPASTEKIKIQEATIPEE